MQRAAGVAQSICIDLQHARPGTSTGGLHHAWRLDKGALQRSSSKSLVAPPHSMA